MCTVATYRKVPETKSRMHDITCSSIACYKFCIFKYTSVRSAKNGDRAQTRNMYTTKSGHIGVSLISMKKPKDCTSGIFWMISPITICKLSALSLLLEFLTCQMDSGAKCDPITYRVDQECDQSDINLIDLPCSLNIRVFSLQFTLLRTWIAKECFLFVLAWLHGCLLFLVMIARTTFKDFIDDQHGDKTTQHKSTNAKATNRLEDFFVGLCLLFLRLSYICWLFVLIIYEGSQSVRNHNLQRDAEN